MSRHLHFSLKGTVANLKNKNPEHQTPEATRAPAAAVNNAVNSSDRQNILLLFLLLLRDHKAAG